MRCVVSTHSCMNINTLVSIMVPFFDMVDTVHAQKPEIYNLNHKDQNLDKFVKV
jgi:hypothetical protein